MEIIEIIQCAISVIEQLVLQFPDIFSHTAILSLPQRTRTRWTNRQIVCDNGFDQQLWGIKQTFNKACRGSLITGF